MRHLCSVLQKVCDLRHSSRSRPPRVSWSCSGGFVLSFRTEILKVPSLITHWKKSPVPFCTTHPPLRRTPQLGWRVDSPPLYCNWSWQFGSAWTSLVLKGNNNKKRIVHQMQRNFLAVNHRHRQEIQKGTYASARSQSQRNCWLSWRCS